MNENKAKATIRAAFESDHQPPLAGFEARMQGALNRQPDVRRSRWAAEVATAVLAIAVVLAFTLPRTWSTFNQAPANHAPQTRALIVPGVPTAAMIAQYAGFNANPPFRLQASIRIADPLAVKRLAMEINALPPPPTYVVHCALDDDSYYMVTFEYSAGAPVVLNISSAGCFYVTRNVSTVPVAWARLSPSLFIYLSQLLRNGPTPSP
jgi:hypothetical protein